MIALVVSVVAIASLGCLARWGRVYPHRPLIYLTAAPAILSVALLWSPDGMPYLLAIDAAVLLIALADLPTLARPHRFDAERSTGAIASLGKSHDVEITLTNRLARPQPVWVRDGLPDELLAEPDELVVSLVPRSRSTIRYRLRAVRRGAFQLNALHLKVRSRLGLWTRILVIPRPGQINVYPDMKQLGEYALLARTNRLSLMGVRRTRKVGQDNEFERLRDYTRDDNYRHIDWRSTARRRKLTVKDFQANQSQRLVFLIDCGRMMTSQVSGVSLLDHAFNAMLMLSYVALRQGDQVGLLCFSNAIHNFVPPRGGMKQMNQLLHATFDRFPDLVESRYDEAFLHLATHVRKRTLVVLVTNLIDEVNAESVQRHLATLSGRHLPLGVLLRDHSLFDFLARPEERCEDQELRLYTTAAAAEIVTWRHHVLADLETKGVLALDVFPEQMTAPLVNRYLDIKARHLL